MNFLLIFEDLNVCNILDVAGGVLLVQTDQIRGARRLVRIGRSIRTRGQWHGTAQFHLLVSVVLQEKQ